LRESSTQQEQWPLVEEYNLPHTPPLPSPDLLPNRRSAF
jgi:hypothetical protein